MGLGGRHPKQRIGADPRNLGWREGWRFCFFRLPLPLPSLMPAISSLPMTREQLDSDDVMQMHPQTRIAWACAC